MSNEVAFLGDTHFGYRIDNDAFNAYVKNFYETEFFPTLIDRNIDTVIQFGDLMDNRRFISIKTLYFIKEVFLDPLREAGIKLITFLGNHDVYYKNTNDYNSVSHVLSMYDNVTLFEKIAELEMGNTKFGFVPWLNKENIEEFDYWNKFTNCDILLGHLELTGFEYAKGIKADHGMETEPFKSFKAVYSGHYHTSSNNGTIHYIGTPYEMTFADMDDEKGFWIFNTDTQEIERVKSEQSLFKKIKYDDEKTDYDTFDFTEFENTYIKLYVMTRKDTEMYNRFIDKLYQCNAIEIKVVETDLDVNDEEMEEINLEVQTTIQIMNDTIKEVEDINTDNVLSIVNDLYKEATLTEVE